MILGMTLFTFIHVAISLIAILSGLIVLFGMVNNNRMDMMTAIFLLFTVATSVTGFFFPIQGLTPALIVGTISIALLAVAIAGRYAFAMRGAWRWIYIATAVTAQYFNSFVLVVQSFLKIPVMHALAPSGSEAPFIIAQSIVPLFYVVAGYLAVKRFRP
jgi:hypothetical protein